MTSSARPFKSVLIANRGEIAVRIVREAKAAGLRSIAVYSDADAGDPWYVRAADAAYHIGPAAPRESYLNAEKILHAAKQTGAEAIHPGYGFLSENADFAQSVIDAGLVWIGPAPNAIRAMGDKGAAKQIARKADVPVIPGYDGDDQSDAHLLAEAKKIGWPVLIKAANGGGGRGQRRVVGEAEFSDALASARRESLSAFASDKIILERALDGVRHVEVQIFGDAHGNIIHLGERDCSVQRRNQKIIEEAPAPGLGEDLRVRMGEAAVRLAKAVNYTNAGTVEFLLDRDGKFYFLEMNTRIQVEHPVTEEVTDTNLIQWQFDVAMGKPLKLKQSDVRFRGHAIEARLCAEDPADGFKPQTGRAYFHDENENARIEAWDSSPHAYLTVTGDYDSMLAKVIARGGDRTEAIAALRRALGGIEVNSLRTNRNFLIDILDDADFKAPNVDIGWVARRPQFAEHLLDSDHGKLAALILTARGGKGWRSTGPARTIVMLRERGAERTFIVDAASIGDLTVTGSLTRDEWTWIDVAQGPAQWKASGYIQGNTIHIHTESDSRDALFEDITYAPAEPKDSAGDGAVRAPMAGKIVRVNVELGAKVEKGQVLVILEAMKMEHEITARISGTVASVNVKVGDQATNRQVLATIVAT